MTTLGELMQLCDGQLTVDLVASVLLGPEQHESPTWGGIRLGADAAELEQLGIDLAEVEFFSESDGTDQAAEHHLEVIEEDGRVTASSPGGVVSSKHLLASTHNVVAPLRGRRGVAGQLRLRRLWP